MRTFSLLLWVVTATFSFAQEPSSVQKEIDRLLWKPFKAAFETGDASALNALYAEHVLRVTPNGIDTENNFKQGNVKRFDENRKSKTTIALDFWFDSRHTNATTSYEVGFYRMTLKNANGPTHLYGQFHIVLKKQKEGWKIVQDWDTTEINGHKITASDFEQKLPIQFD